MSINIFKNISAGNRGIKRVVSTEINPSFSSYYGRPELGFLYEENIFLEVDGQHVLATMTKKPLRLFCNYKVELIERNKNGEPTTSSYSGLLAKRTHCLLRARLLKNKILVREKR